MGFDTIIWRNINEKTPTFINQFYLYLFINILKYMYFFHNLNDLFPKMTLFL